MDRVLIVSEEVIFTSHVEKTLLEVGFAVATVASEALLIDKINEFQPDVIVVKGGSVKLSSLRVGQALKEVVKFTGKVILILTKNQNVDPNDINRVKMDYLLFEPVGAVKVVSHVLNLMTEHREVIRSRLMKMAENDSHFRKQEESFIVSGKSVEQELVHVTGKIQKEALTHVKSTEALPSEELSHIKDQIMQELEQNKALHRAKIEAYDSMISNLDVDLHKSHKKRQTKSKQSGLRKELLVDPGQEKLESLDKDRQKFAIALMKKK